MTLWKREEAGDNQEAKREVRYFNEESDFSNPKPERLIERVLTLISKSGDFVLDSCDFGKTDYELNIVHPPVYEDDMEGDGSFRGASAERNRHRGRVQCGDSSIRLRRIVTVPGIKETYLCQERQD